jgi:alkylhydroperoxidase/carboxymuconolactone decarboxylase family protein YurZ
VLRLTGTDRSVAEVAAVAENVASHTAAAAALRLRPDSAGTAVDGGVIAAVRLLDETNAGDARITLEEIRDWHQETLGIGKVPAFWRALAHQPQLLAATWRKDRVIMGPGALDVQIKAYAALAVASFRQSDYWITHYTQVLRSIAGLDDKTLVELSGAVMHYVSFNTVAHGMRLDAPVAGITASDVTPGGRLEHMVPGVKRKTTLPGGDN